MNTYETTCRAIIQRCAFLLIGVKTALPGEEDILSSRHRFLTKEDSGRLETMAYNVEDLGNYYC